MEGMFYQLVYRKTMHELSNYVGCTAKARGYDDRGNVDNYFILRDFLENEFGRQCAFHIFNSFAKVPKKKIVRQVLDDVESKMMKEIIGKKHYLFRNTEALTKLFKRYYSFSRQSIECLFLNKSSTKPFVDEDEPKIKVQDDPIEWAVSVIIGVLTSLDFERAVLYLVLHDYQYHQLGDVRDKTNSQIHKVSYDWAWKLSYFCQFLPEKRRLEVVRDYLYIDDLHTLDLFGGSALSKDVDALRDKMREVVGFKEGK